MKKIIILIMLFVIIPLVSATDFTFQKSEGVDLKIPCFDTNNDFCDTDTNCTLTINNPEGVNVINNQDMTRNDAFYNYTLNTSETDKTGIHDVTMHCTSPQNSGFDKFSLEITASGKEAKTSTAGIAVVIFVLFIVSFLLFIGFKSNITTNILVDLIIKRSCFVLAIYMMILNATIVATIAGAANLDVTREMFMYVSVFGYLGYASMVYLIFKTLIDYLKIWNGLKREDRGFEDEQ